MIKRYWRLLKILPKLGFGNISKVVIYRLELRSGYFHIKAPNVCNDHSESIFRHTLSNIAFNEEQSKEIITETQSLMTGNFSMFGKKHIHLGTPPLWFKIDETNIKVQWFEVPINQKVGEDVKETWELSRFYWAPTLAAAYTISGDDKYLITLNKWVQNWRSENPPNYSVNWVCAQEVAIRSINLLSSAYILQQSEEPSSLLINTIEEHCSRILPTLQYSIAQDNNHGTSEAAGLFIGGAWLKACNRSDSKKAQKYYKTGRKWLENRAKHLIEEDGSSIQYSTNYHRVIIDTYSLAEIWRIKLNLPEFSENLISRVSKANNWLYQITQFETGDAPNLGANDGSNILPLKTKNYRDYRPSVQLSSILFDRERAYKAKGIWDAHLWWLNSTNTANYKPSPSSSDFTNGGYSLLRKGKAFVLFNIPMYKFRPSQSDALHVDMWLNGKNLLQDGGTYSYNAKSEITQYFGGTESHNTIQFDDRDQMPRLSRFLFGEWLKANKFESTCETNDLLTTAANYTDYKGASHRRAVTLSSTTLQVKDTVSGFRHKAVLRWRLQPGNWVLSDTGVSNGNHRIDIASSSPIVRMEITQGWKSLYYLQKTPLPVLEVEIHQPGNLTTEYYFCP